MRNVFILAGCLGMTFVAHSQNVGVGTTSPSQRLDVNGNINTSGNLMINGAAGANGQVLGMNGGAMQWIDKSRFKNWSIYSTPTTTNFVVPTGVTEVLIEMWGGGGGGHREGGGGGSGGYWIGLIPVSGVSSISLTIGSLGTGGQGSTPAGAGGNSGFTCTGFNVVTEGGSGADSSLSINGTETYMGGGGGSGQVALTIPSGFRNYYTVNGNNGSPTTINYIEVSAGTFVKEYTGGVGGVAPYSGNLPCPPTKYLDLSGSNDIRSIFTGGSGGNFGQGGTPHVKVSNIFGGPGRIMIYY